MYELGAVEEIETDPVQRRQCVEDQRGQVRGIGDAIAFARQQSPRLLQQLRVLLGFAAGKVVDYVHRRSLAACALVSCAP